MQSTVKQSVRESLTERGEELLNTSVKEVWGTGVSVTVAIENQSTNTLLHACILTQSTYNNNNSNTYNLFVLVLGPFKVTTWLY